MWPGVIQVITLLASVKPVLPSPDVTATSHAEGGPLKYNQSWGDCSGWRVFYFFMSETSLAP